MDYGTYDNDTRISRLIESSADQNLLQEDLNKILAWSWSSDNNLMLHEHKFDIVVDEANPNAVNHFLPLWSPMMSRILLGFTPHKLLRDLRIIISSDLCMARHIEFMIDKSRAKTSWILSVFKARDPSTMLVRHDITKSHVRSHLEYRCPLWHPSKISAIEVIEGVQRKFTKQINGYQSLPYFQRLDKLRLMSLQRKLEQCIIIKMWKMYQQFVPNDLNVRFHFPFGWVCKPSCLTYLEHVLT